MDLALTRELARLASIVELLRAQREALSELSDIKELRALEADFGEALASAQARGLVPRDPITVIRSDWERLVAWSNPVQLALRTADELGQELEGGLGGEAVESSRRRRRSSENWKPGRGELIALEHALEQAPARLTAVIDPARNELRADDWIDGRPYPELTEVSDAMGWGQTLELAEPPGPWTAGVDPRVRPLVASRLVVEPGSPVERRRMQALQTKLSKVRSLLEQHAAHAAALGEVDRWTGAGEVAMARRSMATLRADFGDLDYAGREGALVRLEKQLESQGHTVAQTRTQLQAFAREAGAFFILPPVDVLRRAKKAVQDAETVIAENAALGQAGRDSEFDRTVAGWTTSLTTDLEALRSGPMNRIRRWIVGASLTWLVVLAAGGLIFQQHQAKQERERQRLAAEVKAVEERALAEARTKAEAEEKERQRLAAEARAKAEAAEIALATKLGLSRPFAAGLRGQAGDVAVRWIPAGRFRMGSPSGEEGRDSDEVAHEVVLSRGFFMGETECTQGQWEAVMGSNPSRFKGGDRPVEQVSWEEAVEYCRKLTAQQRAGGILPEGWAWRLPTEAEWEYAARAGTTGARPGELDAIAWWSGNSGSETHAVKGKQANAWGLHDMMGNVWEWCSDWYGEYPTGEVTDPTGAGSGSNRVLRGGGWYGVARFARSANRPGDDPGLRIHNLGFRPALSSVW